MAEAKDRQDQLKEIARKIRKAETGDINLVISYLAIANLYVCELPHIHSTSATLYTISITQKVMETYSRMFSSRPEKKVIDRTIVNNYRKHIEKAALQLETFVGDL